MNKILIGVIVALFVVSGLGQEEGQEEKYQYQDNVLILTDSNAQDAID